MLACLHVLAFFAVLAQVANAIPQPVLVGSLDPTIHYYPPGSWGYANATDGFSKVQGFGVLMFVYQNNNEAEVLWRTPSKSLNSCQPSPSCDLLIRGDRILQIQRRSCGRVSCRCSIS
jgi:hypothetical protein